MAVNLDACIQCNLCVRACREVQVNDVIGMAYRGENSKIVFDFDDPMGDSTCVACGECVQACPTGALMPASIVDKDGVGHSKVDKKIDSVCPYCGVGCQIEYNVKDNKIKYVNGVDGPANKNRLCVKGRFGFDYVNNPERLTKPLIRITGKEKDLHPSINSKSNRLYFSSNRPGGYGGMDIYYVDLIDDEFSEPVNLGPDINSEYNESFPYSYNDSTLFYSRPQCGS